MTNFQLLRSTFDDFRRSRLARVWLIESVHEQLILGGTHTLLNMHNYYMHLVESRWPWPIGQARLGQTLLHTLYICMIIIMIIIELL